MVIAHKASERISIDLAAYYNRYINLLFLNTSPSKAVFGSIDVQGTTVPVTYGTFGYGGSANVYGVESTVNFIATPWWKLEASHWFIRNEIEQTASGDSPSVAPVRNHQAVLRSLMDLSDALALDTVLRYGDTLPPVLGDLLASSPTLVQLDVRLGWNITPDIELSLVGRDLLSSSQLEFVDEFSTVPIAIKRSVYGRLNWNF